MPLTFLSWTLALLPVMVLLALMLLLRWGGSQAGAAAWVICILIAVLFFGATPQVILISQAKSLLLSLDVLLIIWTALLLYHTADEAGAMNWIGRSLSALTASRTIQGLLVGWVFCSLIQGTGGFGVPAAVTAPLLVALGFDPVRAVVMACVAHGWAVNYGSFATSFQTLLAVTNLPGELLAPDTALLLGFSCYVSGILVAWIGGGFREMLRALPAILILGTVMAVSQYLLAINGLWTLGATGSALAGLAAGVLVTRLPIYRNGPLSENQARAAAGYEGGRPQSLALAFSAYAILLVLAFGINLIPSLESWFNRIELVVRFPEVSTAFGWVTPAETGRKISVFGHPGAILLYSSLFAFLIYRRAGSYRPGAAQRILTKVYKGAIQTSLGILAMIGLGALMGHAGMINLLALGLSSAVSAGVYPLAATLIGALGAFITGSNNASNALFGVLQMRTAELLGQRISLVLGAQTTGGSLGSVLSPAKVIVGCSTTGQSGREGLVLRRLLPVGLVPILLAGLLALIVGWRGLP
jgi:lactate permease